MPHDASEIKYYDKLFLKINNKKKKLVDSKIISPTEFQ